MNLSDYLSYYADFVSEDGGYSVTVSHEDFSKNLPITSEWVTCGDDLEDAVSMARGLIITIAESFIESKVPFPKRTQKKEGQHEINLPVHVALKIMLRTLMVQDKIKVTDLATLMNTSKQNVRQMLDLRKKTHIDHLAAMFRAVNHPLKIEC